MFQLSTCEVHQVENNQYVTVCWLTKLFSFGSLQPLSGRMSPQSPKRRGFARGLNGANGLLAARLAPKALNHFRKDPVKFAMLLENLCLFMTFSHAIQKNCWLNGHLGQNATLNVMTLVPWAEPEFAEMMNLLRLKSRNVLVNLAQVSFLTATQKLEKCIRKITL